MHEIYNEGVFAQVDPIIVENVNQKSKSAMKSFPGGYDKSNNYEIDIQVNETDGEESKTHEDEKKNEKK